MTDILEAKQDLLEYVKSLNYKFELSKTVEEDYFEPGMMENLEQYRGEYDDASNTVVLRVETKGLRYDNRTKNLEHISVGDSVQIIREPDNRFNSNNFTVKSDNLSLGNIPAELCNVLAMMYDKGYAIISSACVSYIERLKERSRYAKQGVLFLEITIKLRGI